MPLDVLRCFLKIYCLIITITTALFILVAATDNMAYIQSPNRARVLTHIKVNLIFNNEERKQKNIWSSKSHKKQLQGNSSVWQALYILNSAGMPVY